MNEHDTSHSERVVDDTEIYRRLELLRGEVNVTPVHPLEVLPGNNLLLGKFETDQDTKAFKQRGAAMALREQFGHLDDLDKELAEVTAFSAGNHAAGVALAAQRLGVRATIFLPADTPKERLDHIQFCGGEFTTLVPVGDTLDESKTACDEYTQESGAFFVHPYDNRHVIDGQSTATAEALLQADAVDTVFVPVGGGGLAAGALEAVAALSPGTKVVLVQIEGSDSAEKSLQAGHVVDASNPNNACDGAKVSKVGKLPFEIMQKYQHMLDIVTVTPADLGKCLQDEELVRHNIEPAMGKTVWDNYPETTGILAQAGARVYANNHPELTDQRWLAIVSGANVNPETEKLAREAYNRSAKVRTSTGVWVLNGLHVN